MGKETSSSHAYAENGKRQDVRPQAPGWDIFSFSTFDRIASTEAIFLGGKINKKRRKIMPEIVNQKKEKEEPQKTEERKGPYRKRGLPAEINLN